MKTSDTRKSVRQRILNELESEHGIKASTEGLLLTTNGKQTLISGPFQVLGEGLDADGKILGVVISRSSLAGIKRRLVPMSALRNPAELAKSLEEMGSRTPIDTKHLKAIAIYVNRMAAVRTVLVPQREGIHWYSSPEGLRSPVVVMGDSVLGDALMRVEPCCSGESAFAKKGTIEDWNAAFRVLLPGNPLLIYSICFGLSAAVATLFDLPRPAALVCGASSTGKTTLGKVILSLWRRPTDPHQWSGTGNGLEALAARSPDVPLVLDELGSRGRDAFLDVLYRLTNGNSKARATGTGGLQEMTVLRSPIFATGELSIWEQAGATGETVRAGHEVRLPTIPVREPYGVYTRVAPHGHGADFARRVSEAINDNYGVVYPAFVEKLLQHRAKIERGLARNRKLFEAELGALESHEPSLSELERRVLSQFVTVTIAGTLAARLELIPVPSKEIKAAIRHVFRSWMKTWRDRQQEPLLAPLTHIRHWLKLNALSGLVDLPEWSSSRKTKVWGYRHELKGEQFFLIHREFFEKELSRDHGTQASVAALKQMGFLKHHKNTNLCSVRMPGATNGSECGRMSFYAISSRILFDDGDS